MCKFLYISSILALIFSYLAVPSDAYADDYGYIVGTLNTTEYSTNLTSYPFPYGVEKEETEGRFKHYYFFVNVGTTIYRCMIDIKDAYYYEPPYRVVTMRAANTSYYNSVLGKSYGWYPITQNTSDARKLAGALDYHRHPGILKDMIGGRPWQYYYGDSSNYNDYYTWQGLLLWEEYGYHYADEFDALFENVSKLYVFGEKFIQDDGQVGIHSIHQNQGDHDNGFTNGKDIYQDGGVIFEYPDGTRKLLMIKFGDHTINGTQVNGQKDFSYSTDPDGTGPIQLAEGVDPIETVIWFDPEEYPNGHRYGPYYAEQIEIVAGLHEFDCMSYNDLDIYVSESPNVSPSYYRMFARNNGCINEYIRSSRDLMKTFTSYNTNRYYIYVNPWEMYTTVPIYIRYSNH